MIHWPPTHSLSLSNFSLSPHRSFCSNQTSSPPFLSFPNMAMVRGVAAAIPTATALVLWVALHLRLAHAATYTVGDSSGWTFNVESWTDGRSFRAGDILVFKYDPKDHNVVAVDQYSYDTCTVGEGAKVYNSGNDSIELVKGENCFICSSLNHCDAGIKIHMIAL